jgi:uncharacterized protein (TIGR04255 family)
LKEAVALATVTHRRGNELQQESHNWQPVHENHAIEVMAVKVDFAELVPLPLLRRALRVAEEGAFAAGLRSRHTLGGQISGGSGVVLGVIQGQIFNAGIETVDSEPVPLKVSEQLQVDQTAITYRTWRYVSWSWQAERVKSLLLPVVDTVYGIVSIAHAQLEYLDRFRFDGPPNSAAVALLLKEGAPLVAPQIFSKSDLWHSHTGAYLPSGDQTKRLQTVNVDAINDPAQGDNMRRWVNIVTLRRDTFSADVVHEGGPSSDKILELLNTMHTELKDLLGMLITDAMASRIYLRDAP